MTVVISDYITNRWNKTWLRNASDWTTQIYTHATHKYIYISIYTHNHRTFISGPQSYFFWNKPEKSIKIYHLANGCSFQICQTDQNPNFLLLQIFRTCLQISHRCNDDEYLHHHSFDDIDTCQPPHNISIRRRPLGIRSKSYWIIDSQFWATSISCFWLVVSPLSSWNRSAVGVIARERCLTSVKMAFS